MAPAFNPSEWLCCGKKFPRPTPRYISDALNSVLAIPDSAAVDIPHSSQPLATLPDYLLPKLDSTTSVSFTFSMEPTQLDPLELPCLRVPEHSVIMELERAVGQAWFDGKTSFTLPYICKKRLPLWCINYWFHIRPALRVAESCRVALKWCSSIGMKDDIETLMWSVAWGKPIDWAGGDGSVDAGVLAQQLLGHRWICDSTIGAMLSLIQQEVIASDPSHKSRVLPPGFATLFKPDRRFFNTYSRKRAPKLFLIGSQLAMGALRAIYYSINVGGTHWVAIGIELATKLLLYGDSLDYLAPSSHFDLVEQWLSKHGLKGFSRQTMPHALQDDGYSCGVVHVNAIAHRVLQTPLWQPAQKDAIRVDWFRRILEAHVSLQLKKQLSPLSDDATPTNTASRAPETGTAVPDDCIDIETHSLRNSRAPMPLAPFAAHVLAAQGR
ncbi:hypothetical protein AURDEDRAFT_172624 [Auricularia subglabra TFB-10046 SS5]|nr:hypothetical protein AURDEDRAFT_172624 [Auricularia subglabra TFB-10046 SS5]